MKAQDLTGAKLAMWVALALGYRVMRDGDHKGAKLCVCLPDDTEHSFSKYGWRDQTLTGPLDRPSLKSTEYRPTQTSHPNAQEIGLDHAVEIG